MPKEPYYSDAQWKWIHDRIGEGYTKKECAEFLGVHRSYIPIKFEMLGFAYHRDDRVPLDQRKGEFYALCDKRL